MNISRSFWMRITGVVAGLVLTGAQLGMGAVTEGTETVTLTDLVREGMGNNPEARYYEAEIQAAQAGRRAAGRWSNPEVTGTLGQKQVRGSGGNLLGEGMSWSAGVMQPFEWPGRIGLRKAIANHDLELARLGLSRFRAALAGKIRLLGFELYAAKEKQGAAQEVADRFAALREVLVQRDPAGLTPVLETRVIEATELTLRRRSAENELKTGAVLLELNQLAGRPLTNRLTIASPDLTFRPAPDTGSLLASAQTNNFDLKLRVVELAQQGFKVDLARNERYPRFSVGPFISEEHGTDRDRMVGVGLSFPLPLWNRGRDSVEAARARQSQAETLLLVAQRDLERKILENALAYRSKVEEISRWRPDSIQHFREAAELADRHYRLGAVPVSIYVELKKQYLDAVEAVLETRREALEAAQTLQLLTGSEEGWAHPEMSR